jgi:hypothetical protein
MKDTSRLGVILLGTGIIVLAYFFSPVRLMFQSPIGPHPRNLLPPVLGGLAVVSGIALLLAVRPRTIKK